MLEYTNTLPIEKENLLLFGGPYSNLEALQALKKEAEKLDFLPENCICTGDIVAYCSDSEKSLQFIKNWGVQCILGNVEEQLRDEKDDCGCNFEEGSSCDILSNQWYPKAKIQVSDDSLAYIASLPSHILFETQNRKKALVVHGSSEYISEFIFETDKKRMKEEFVQNNVDIIIAGHCGLPFYKEIEIDGNIKQWINPGVIGMPANNGKLHTYFGVLNPNTLKYTEKTLEYNYFKTAKKMRKNNFPESYATTLSQTGYWPSEDILPTELRRSKN